MKIEISKKKQYIDCGDLVYSDLLSEYGFIGYIEEEFYFIDKNKFQNYSEGYQSLDELISRCKLELIAKNKELNVSMKNY